jgi:hypothetical protein
MHSVRLERIWVELYGLPSNKKFNLVVKSALSRTTGCMPCTECTCIIFRLLGDYQRLVCMIFCYILEAI